MPWTKNAGRRRTGEVARDGLELADEELADDLALGFGIGHPGERLEEPVLRLHVDQLDAELTRERLFDLLALVLAHETGVDEDAGELGPDGLGDERRRHRGVDAARERAEHTLPADLLADGGDLVFDDRGVGPRRAGSRATRWKKFASSS